ncbi:MAG: response regulator [Saprospiraceae bacterium]|nr:response regulator [Saprospiraceae bacterium]
MSASLAKRKAWCHIVLLCLFLPFTSFGNRSVPLPSYRFQSITVNDNLSHSDVNCVVQDSLGYIWIGTNNGLNRFDGYSVETFKYNLEDQRSIPGNRIQHLLVDPTGQIWVAIQHKGLFRFYPNEMNFRKVPLPFSEIISMEMALSGTGDIWVNKKTKGLCRISICAEGDIKAIDVYDHQKIGLGEGANNLDFLEGGTNGVYVMANDNSLYHFASEEEGFVQVLSASNWEGASQWHVNSLLEDGPDLWLATSRGALRLRPDQERQIYESHLFQTDQRPYEVSLIYKDFDGQFWLATSSGLRILNQTIKEEGTFTADALVKVDFTGTTFQNNRIRHLFQDRFGVLWVGSTGGVNYTNLRNKAFRYLKCTMPGKTQQRNIAAVYKADDGKIWTGSNSGLYIYDPVAGKGTEYRRELASREIQGRYVVFFHKDHRGDIWLGIKGGMLTRVHQEGDNLQFEHWPVEGNNGVRLGDNLMQMSEDNLGRLWITTHRDGLFILDQDRQNYTHIQHDPTDPNSLSSNNLTAIYTDPLDGSMWVSTRDGGLNHLIEEQAGQWQFEHYRYDADNPRSLSSDHTWQVLRTQDNQLWVATLGGGLNKVIEGEELTFERFTMSDGLTDNDVECLAEDDQGHLWLSGMGLTRFNPEDGTIQYFDYQDGLQSNSFKVGAVHKDDQGWLYFGGINGLNYFDPSSIKTDQPVPETYITGLQVNSQPIKVGEEVKGRVLLEKSLFDQPAIRLKANESDFTIHFVGVQMASALKNHYRFQLEGLNNDNWSEARYPNLSANYSNIPPGDYTFKVMASNGDGVWSNEVAQLPIHIASPWYATPLAFVVYGLLGILSLVLFRQVTEKQLVLKNELILAEKEQELNQYKLNFFTNISHELRSPLTLIRGPLEELLLHTKVRKETKVKLRIMQNSSNRLLNLMNQLLDFRKIETGNMRLQAAEGNFVKFCEEVFLIFSKSASEKNIQFRFETPTKTIPLTYDRDKMETVLMNLLSNAYKFTKENGCITISLRVRGQEEGEAVFDAEGLLQNNYLLIEVIDSGSGMDSAEIEKVFNPYYQAKNQDTLHIAGTGIGLSLVKGMIDLHKGQVTVQSQRHKGTTFSIKLPLGSNHLTGDQIIPNFRNSEYLGHYLPEENRHLIANNPTQDHYLKVISDRSRKYKVAIVEDNSALRTYLRQVLEEDFVVTEAADGKEGLQMIMEDPPDLIVSDVMMPEMDGIRLCKAIKETELIAHLPIILLTARTSRVYELEGLGMGAESYITKPFNAQMLKSRIYAILKNRQHLREYYRKQLFFEPVKENQLTPEEKLVHQAIELVEAHLEDADFNVQRLAEMLHQSQSSLYRKIKAVTGKSLVEFVRDVRLRRAAEMIRTGDLTITEIAYKVGFSSIKYFRQCFKNLYQMTPSAFGQLKEVPQQNNGLIQSIRSIGG